MKTHDYRALIMPVRGLLIAWALSATCAEAQLSPSLDLRLPQPADAPVLASQGDDATPGVYVADSATSVHGTFSTGIGYSKAFGNSTINTADLDVNKHYDDGRTLNLHIDVLHSTGLPAATPRDYVSRYNN
jgi:hypothetical protein